MILLGVVCQHVVTWSIRFGKDYPEVCGKNLGKKS